MISFDSSNSNHQSTVWENILGTIRNKHDTERRCAIIRPYFLAFQSEDIGKDNFKAFYKSKNKEAINVSMDSSRPFFARIPVEDRCVEGNNKKVFKDEGDESFNKRLRNKAVRDVRTHLADLIKEIWKPLQDYSTAEAESEDETGLSGTGSGTVTDGSNKKEELAIAPTALEEDSTMKLNTEGSHQGLETTNVAPGELGLNGEEGALANSTQSSPSAANSTSELEKAEIERISTTSQPNHLKDVPSLLQMSEKAVDPSTIKTRSDQQACFFIGFKHSRPTDVHRVNLLCGNKSEDGLKRVAYFVARADKIDVETHPQQIWVRPIPIFHCF